MRHRVIRLRPDVSKNSEGRSLPLEGPLSELFKRHWEGRNMQWVFHRNNRPIGDFRKAWLSGASGKSLVESGKSYKETCDGDQVEKVDGGRAVGD